MQTCAQYVRMAPPRPAETLPTPAETNTSHIGRLCEKTLQEHPRFCKASGATPVGALERPHGRAHQPGGKSVPSASINLCGFLTDTTAEARGLLSGTAIGPPSNRGNPFSFANNETQINSQTVNCTPRNHGLVTGAHGPGNLRGPPKRSAQHPSGETPLRSRGTTPYHQNSASLEGWTTPRAKLRLTRGLDAPQAKLCLA
jgi:hypothetical protein